LNELIEKMNFNHNDLVSVVVTGSKETDNLFFDSYGKCKNVQVIQDLEEPVSLGLFKKIENIKDFGKQNSELVETLELSNELIVLKCKKLKWKKRLNFKRTNHRYHHDHRCWL
jgi:hypothetical protein